MLEKPANNHLSLQENLCEGQARRLLCSEYSRWCHSPNPNENQYLTATERRWER